MTHMFSAEVQGERAVDAAVARRSDRAASHSVSTSARQAGRYNPELTAAGRVSADFSPTVLQGGA